jgi:hypothetical protein
MMLLGPSGESRKSEGRLQSLARSTQPGPLSTVLSTGGKIWAYRERISDQAIFPTYLALSRSEQVRIVWENHPAIVPNQALYQAEPQPELIVSPARQRAARPYFACFATRGKKLSQATLCNIESARQKLAV